MQRYHGTPANLQEEEPLSSSSKWQRTDCEALPEWLDNRIKLDAFHAMKRVQEAISKRHGAYNHFLARFRDAMFLLNQDDISAMRAAIARSLQKEKLSPKQIELRLDAKFEEDFHLFLRHCRRRIPAPPELYRALQRLETEYGHIEDALTGL